MKDSNLCFPSDLCFPVDIGEGTNITDETVKALHLETEKETNPEFFPLGASAFWDGGVHFSVPEKSPVYACADGKVIAAFLCELANESQNLFEGVNFILLQHTLPNDSSKTWYSIYLYLNQEIFDDSNDFLKEIAWIKKVEHSALTSNIMVNLNIPVKAGELIWRSGVITHFEKDTKGTSGQEEVLDWQIFSEKKLFGDIEEVVVADETWLMKPDELFKRIDEDSSGTLEIREIINFFHKHSKAKKIRNDACKLLSDSIFEVKAFVDRLLEFGFEIDLFELENAIAPYLWWRHILKAGGGSSLPQSKYVWNYNPITFLERLQFLEKESHPLIFHEYRRVEIGRQKSPTSPVFTKLRGTVDYQYQKEWDQSYDKIPELAVTRNNEDYQGVYSTQKEEGVPVQRKWVYVFQRRNNAQGEITESKLYAELFIDLEGNYHSVPLEELPLSDFNAEYPSLEDRTPIPLKESETGETQKSIRVLLKASGMNLGAEWFEYFALLSHIQLPWRKLQYSLLDFQKGKDLTRFTPFFPSSLDYMRSFQDRYEKSLPQVDFFSPYPSEPSLNIDIIKKLFQAKGFPTDQLPQYQESPEEVLTEPNPIYLVDHWKELLFRHLEYEAALSTLYEFTEGDSVVARNYSPEFNDDYGNAFGSGYLNPLQSLERLKKKDADKRFDFSETFPLHCSGARMKVQKLTLSLIETKPGLLEQPWRELVDESRLKEENGILNEVEDDLWLAINYHGERLVEWLENDSFLAAKRDYDDENGEILIEEVTPHSEELLEEHVDVVNALAIVRQMKMSQATEFLHLSLPGRKYLYQNQSMALKEFIELDGEDDFENKLREEGISNEEKSYYQLVEEFFPAVRRVIHFADQAAEASNILFNEHSKFSFLREYYEAKILRGLESLHRNIIFSNTHEFWLYERNFKDNPKALNQAIQEGLEKHYRDLFVGTRDPNKTQNLQQFSGEIKEIQKGFETLSVDLRNYDQATGPASKAAKKTFKELIDGEMVKYQVKYEVPSKILQINELFNLYQMVKTLKSSKEEDLLYNAASVVTATMDFSASIHFFQRKDTAVQRLLKRKVAKATSTSLSTRQIVLGLWKQNASLTLIQKQALGKIGSILAKGGVLGIFGVISALVDVWGATRDLQKAIQDQDPDMIMARGINEFGFLLILVGSVSVFFAPPLAATIFIILGSGVVVGGTLGSRYYSKEEIENWLRLGPWGKDSNVSFTSQEFQKKYFWSKTFSGMESWQENNQALLDSSTLIFHNCTLKLQWTPVYPTRWGKRAEVFDLTIYPNGMGVHDTLRLNLKLFGEQVILDRNAQELESFKLGEAIDLEKQGKLQVYSDELLPQFGEKKEISSKEERHLVGEVDYANESGFLLNGHPSVEIEYHTIEQLKLTENSLQKSLGTDSFPKEYSTRLQDQLLPQIKSFQGEAHTRKNLHEKLEALDFGLPTEEQKELYGLRKDLYLNKFLGKISPHSKDFVFLEGTIYTAYLPHRVALLVYPLAGKIYADKATFEKILEALPIEKAIHQSWIDSVINKILKHAEGAEKQNVGYKSFHLRLFKAASSLDDHEIGTTRHRLEVKDGKPIGVLDWFDEAKEKYDKENPIDSEYLVERLWDHLTYKIPRKFEIEGSIQFSKMEVEMKETYDNLDPKVETWVPYPQKQKATWKGVFLEKTDPLGPTGKHFSWNLNENWLDTDEEKVI